MSSERNRSRKQQYDWSGANGVPASSAAAVCSSASQLRSSQLAIISVGAIAPSVVVPSLGAQLRSSLRLSNAALHRLQLVAALSFARRVQGCFKRLGVGELGCPTSHWCRRRSAVHLHSAVPAAWHTSALAAMKQRHTVQRQFESAFDNYLKLTDLLRADLDSMLLHESKALHWRRNFVRASVALLEGHAHCLRQLCVVALMFDTAGVNSKERRVIEDEQAFDTTKRMKLTLSAAYKLFALDPRPNFGTGHWNVAQRAIRKRHRLMHPKNPRDLGMSDSTWRMHKRGIVWLMGQFFDFLSLSQAKYGS